MAGTRQDGAVLELGPLTLIMEAMQSILAGGAAGRGCSREEEGISSGGECTFPAGSFCAISSDVVSWSSSCVLLAVLLSRCRGSLARAVVHAQPSSFYTNAYSSATCSRSVSCCILLSLHILSAERM